MDFVKYTMIILSISTTAALYGAYYTSNMLDIKTDAKAGSGEIIEEQKLFKKYKLQKNGNTEENKKEDDKTKKLEIFKEEAPELKIIRTNISKDNKFNPEKKLTISFGEEVDIYSLLGFKKVINGEYTCDGEKIKSNKKAVRCKPENKLFITKSSENQDNIFKGVVKKSEIDKKIIFISTKIEELEEYKLTIKKGVKSFKEKKSNKSDNSFFSVTKEDFTIKFYTTDKDGNTIENENEKDSGNKVGDNESENLSITHSKTKEEKEKELMEWIKKKEAEIGPEELNKNVENKEYNEVKKTEESNNIEESNNTETSENTEKNQEDIQNKEKTNTGSTSTGSNN